MHGTSGADGTVVTGTPLYGTLLPQLTLYTHFGGSLAGSLYTVSLQI